MSVPSTPATNLPGQLFVLAGPSAVGKGTVVKALQEKYSGFTLSISATTRPPRTGEKDGVDYFFISDAHFDRLIAQDGFLEWAQVHGKHRYGTLKQQVVETLSKGQKVLLEIDLAGARQVRSHSLPACFIFLSPPSKAVLIERLLGRGTETAQEQAQRMKTAEVEMAAASEFDKIVTNTEVEQAAYELAEIMGIA